MPEAPNNPFRDEPSSVVEAPNNPFREGAAEVIQAPNNPFAGPSTYPPKAAPDNTALAAHFESTLGEYFREQAEKNTAHILMGQDRSAATLDGSGNVEPKFADGFLEHFKAGFGMSVTGLKIKGGMPEVVLGPESDTKGAVAYAVGQTVGDLPAMFAGSAIGGLATAEAGPAAAAGAWYGGNALPAAMRKIYIDQYERGEIDSFGEFWERATGMFWEQLKAGTVGLATGKVGEVVSSSGKVAKAVAKVSSKAPAAVQPAAKSLLSVGLRLPSEAATMTAIGAALEGHMPSAQDFWNATVTVGALHGVTSATLAGGSKVKGKFQKIFVESGLHPKHAAEIISKDPLARQQMLSTDDDIPTVFKGVGKELGEPQGPKSAPIEPPKVEYTGQGDVLELDGLVDDMVKGINDGEITYEQVGEVVPLLGLDDVDSAYVSQKVQNIYEPPKVESIPIPEKLLEPKHGQSSDPGDADSKLIVSKSDEGGGGGKKPPGPPVDKDGVPFDDDELHILSKVGDRRDKADRRSWRAKVSDTWSYLYKHAFEEYNPLRKLEKEIREMSEGADINFEPTNRFVTQQSAGLAERFFEYGAEDFGTKKTTTRGLKEILMPVAKDIRKYDAYKIAARTLELANRMETKPDGTKVPNPIKTPIDVEVAKRVVAKGKKQFGKIHAEEVAWNDAVLKYFKDAGGLSDAQFEAITTMNRNFVPLNRIFDGAKTGFGRSLLTNPKKKIHGTDKYQIIEPTQSIIKNTIELAMMAEKNRAARELVDMAAEVGKELHDTATEGTDAEGTKPKTTGLEGLVEKVPQKMKPIKLGDDEMLRFMEQHGLDSTDINLVEAMTIFRPQALRLAENEFVVLRGGKKEVWKVKDPEVAKLYVGRSRGELNLIEKVAKPFKDVLTTTATASLEFISRNPVVDSLTAYLTEGAVPVYTQLVGLGELFKHKFSKDGSNVVEAWLSGGGSMKAVKEIADFGKQYEYYKEIDKSPILRQMWDSQWNAVRHLWSGLTFLRDTSEAATRLGVASKVMNELTAGGKKELSAIDIYEVGQRTRQSTIDFLRGGITAKNANMAVSFLSVNLQALDVGFRALNTREGKQRLAPIVAMTMTNWWVNKDDERIKAMKRWKKDNFWLFPTDKWTPAEYGEDIDAVPDYLKRTNEAGQVEINKGVIYKLKKPSILIPFTSLPERIMDAMYNDDPRAFRDFDQSLADAFIPDMVPTILRPALEQTTNYSFFTNHQMVPAHLEGVAPEYRYTPYTSETAKLLGKGISKLPVVDDTGFAAPIVIENYVRAWSAGIGSYVLGTLDNAMIGTGVINPPVAPEKPITQQPGFRAWMESFPTGSTRYLDDFFERFTKTKQNYGTLSLLAKRNGMEAEYESFLASTQENEMTKLDGYKKVIGEHQEVIQYIRDDRDMSPKEKFQLIEAQLYNLLNVSKEAVEFIDEMDADFAKVQKELGRREE